MAKRAEYGRRLVAGLSERLSAEFGAGFSRSNLWDMRRFYQAFPILQTVSRELTWSHHRLLLRVEKPEARSFYLAEAVNARWSTRELERQINSLLFERLALSRDKEGCWHWPSTDTRSTNRLTRSFVLIDLKVGELTHQDLGQMQMYVNYYHRELTAPDENPPIGIVLCAGKSEAVVRYRLPEGNAQIFASRYKLYLPTEEELAAELQREPLTLYQFRVNRPHKRYRQPRAQGCQAVEGWPPAEAAGSLAWAGAWARLHESEPRRDPAGNGVG